jgi:hypothetical protein
VIVGRLGAGKTVYLRRLRNFQARQESVYADHPQQNLPSTEAIVKACQWFPERFLTEKWMQVWNRATLSALATHLLAHPDLKAYISQDQAESIRYDYGHLLGEFRRPRSIYVEVRTIINGQHTARQLTEYLEDTAWYDLEDVLAEVLRTCPPIFFYLDAVDEEFSHAPMYWLRCQKGLFYQVMRFLRDPRLGGRLHLVISIRDIVMSSVYRSEHAPRYHDEPHIRVLSWSRESIEYLLVEKLRRLDPSYSMAPGSFAHPVEAWLGTPVVHNQARGVHERVTDYLLRHTRLIPGTWSRSATPSAPRSCGSGRRATRSCRRPTCGGWYRAPPGASATPSSPRRATRSPPTPCRRTPPAAATPRSTPAPWSTLPGSTRRSATSSGRSATTASPGSNWS